MATDRKRVLTIDVLAAARERIRWTLETFPRVYLSGPSGKDSGVMMHIACQEARAAGKKIGVLFIDMEAQYRSSIDWCAEMFALYADVVDPHWVALPLNLRNAVSVHQPFWTCWEPGKEAAWVRQRHPLSVSDPGAYPFYRDRMEFEEFVDDFGDWYGQGKAAACLVGIRAAESLNRWRAVANDRGSRLDGRCYTTWKTPKTCNVYPIYDWQTADVWTYYGKTRLPYNRIYDMMQLAGVPLHSQRICQPYGDDQRRGLSLFQVVEPETWPAVVARVAGANQGAIYAGKRGAILGNGKVSKPPGHTWESYARFLLESMPQHEADHYRAKFRVFLKWWIDRGYPNGIPDEADAKEEAARRVPSWRRVCKTILRNDHLCKHLSFSQTGSESYERYMKVQRNRERTWGKLGL